MFQNSITRIKSNLWYQIFRIILSPNLIFFIETSQQQSKEKNTQQNKFVFQTQENWSIFAGKKRDACSCLPANISPVVNKVPARDGRWMNSPAQTSIPSLVLYFIVSPADFPHRKNSPGCSCALTERFIHLRSSTLSLSFSLSRCALSHWQKGIRSENTSRVPTFGPRAFCPSAIDACNLYFGHRPRRRFKDWCANAEPHSVSPFSLLSVAVPWNNKIAGGAFCSGERTGAEQQNPLLSLTDCRFIYAAARNVKPKTSE